ncbi:GGDEF domain-containing protein [Vibrio hannami]|uniref:GGDEF domain-containing protein n=1 Tax=Vibrio hannami TaxID=2717094 RepID=UPI00240EF9D1|nr:GGDEF domain-containing protein [Vibrio hannami]MDG3085486.1 GGDEF domain-containing protein [Vibrio hannami]
MQPISGTIETNIHLAANLPYLLFLICILLCQLFNQGRIGMVTFAMCVTYYVIQERLQSPLSTGTTKLEYLLLAFIFPVACITASLYKECKLFTTKGLSYLVILAMLITWGVITVVHVQETGLNEFWQNALFTVPELSKLPVLIFLYSTFVTGWYGIRVLKFNKSIDAAIYTCQVLTLLTFVLFDTNYISATLFSLTGVMLIVIVITTSHELAYVDQLTGIPGRRALETEMRHLGRKYTIAMLDVDHFKKFNDTYGHDTGDDVLKLVASKMMNTRGKAKVYRYGGEEFTVLFKGKYTDDSHPFLEELRENIADYQMTIRNMNNRPKNNKVGSKQRKKQSENDTVSVTISIGMADSYDTKNPESVLKAADEALYRAKQSGRNRVSD